MKKTSPKVISEAREEFFSNYQYQWDQPTGTDIFNAGWYAAMKFMRELEEIPHKYIKEG